MIYLSLSHMIALLAATVVFLLFITYIAWRERWQW